MEKILIVEDDEMVRCGIEDVLKMRDWNTETASTFAEGMKKIKANKYMLYILDMKLPDGNGITLCREIRKKTCNPVLFLSAYDSEGYIVEGFEAGGDDYVIKPFRTFELLARIKSLLKRSAINQEEKRKIGIKSGEFVLNFERQCLIKNNIPIELTLTEYRILYCLIANSPQIISRSKLLEIIWDYNENYVDDNALSVYINRIRNKIAGDSEKVLIETKRGIGYMWTLKTEEIYEIISEKWN